ncbi:MAG: HEAT repeat domain-containing protein [Fimbriimonadaceae bacterium]|nr:HEAT repeat domain-containing protein [Fimbriimonadaceae bacterium]
MSRQANRESSPRRQAVWLLLGLLVFAVLLGVYNAWRTAETRKLALGSPSSAQRDYFVASVDRPEVESFFKALPSSEKVRFAKNLGAHDAPGLAKLIVKLLATFDKDARDALTESLVRLAKTQTKAVAEQLTQTGGFQRYAVFRALAEAGETSLNATAGQLSVTDARTNAVAFLVSEGSASVPPLLRQLAHKDKDVRGAAAEALGKLRAREAVDALTERYRTAPVDEGIAYLTALSAIADPRSRDLLREAFVNPQTRPDLRSVSALGLGRIGRPEDLKLLWDASGTPDLDLQVAIVSGLQFAGEASLTEAPLSLISLRVAAGVKGPRSDALIERGLASGSRPLLAEAARATRRRPELVGALERAVRRYDPAMRGDLVDPLLEALAQTEAGHAVLRRLADDQAVGSLASRRLALAASGG